MMPFLFLLFMHCLADFPLQGEWLAKEKGKELLFMIAHCVIWTGMVSLGLHLMGMLSMWKIGFLFFGHLAADQWKCSKAEGRRVGLFQTFIKYPSARQMRFSMYLDQLIHMFQLLIVVVLP